MEGLVYLSVRVGCAAYLLYKVWGQKKKVHELYAFNKGDKVSCVTCCTRR